MGSLLGRMVAALPVPVRHAASLATPAAIGAAVALFVGHFGYGEQTTPGESLLDPGAAAIGAVLGIAAVFGLALGLAKVTQPGDGPRWVAAATVVTRWGLPLLLLPLVSPLSTGLARSSPLSVLALAAYAGVVMAFFGFHLPERWAVAAPDRARATRHWLTAAVALVAIAYAVELSRLAIANHLSFNTDRADLGYYVSVFRRSSLGDFLGCTICEGGNHAYDGHFDPILVLLSPLYLIYPEAETLLVLQSVWLASTVAPLYLLTRHYGLPLAARVLVPLCFCLHPALHGVNLFDFHSMALMVPLVVWLLWAHEAGRLRWYWVFFGLLLLTREDASLVALTIAVYVLASRWPEHWRRAALTAAISVGYFFFAKWVMGGSDAFAQQDSRGYAYYYEELVPKGGGATDLVLTLLTEPAKVIDVVAKEKKVVYALQLLIPVALLPLLARRGRFLLLYGFAFTLLASRVFVYSIHFHYSSLLLPFLFVLTTAALGRCHDRTGCDPVLRARWAHAGAFAMLGATLVCSWQFGAIVANTSFRAGFRELKRKPTKNQLALDAYLKETCRTLPPGTSVAANERQLPHLGRCHAIYRKHQRRMADYVVWVHHSGRSNTKIRKDVRQGYLELEKQTGKWELFRTNYPNQKIVKE